MRDSNEYNESEELYSQQKKTEISNVNNSTVFSTKESTVLKNQPFDEVFEADSSDESIDTPKRREQNSIVDKQNQQKPEQQQQQQQQVQNSQSIIQRKPPQEQQSYISEEDDEVQLSGSDYEDDASITNRNNSTINFYNPSNFTHLDVSTELKDLFTHILAYKPHSIDLETKLKPFIPEYIPSVGDIDPFVKIPRPDGQSDFLGLNVLDEPCSNQSDPTVVALNLTYSSRDITTKTVNIPSIENADKNPKRILKWINDIKELHKSKPLPSVKYSNSLPDINFLMQVWSDQFEELLQQVEIPPADINVELEDYVKIVCTLLDIPVYENIIESLHVVFTLYLEFKTNQHFGQQISNI